MHVLVFFFFCLLDSIFNYVSVAGLCCDLFKVVKTTCQFSALYKNFKCVFLVEGRGGVGVPLCWRCYVVLVCEMFLRGLIGIFFCARRGFHFQAVEALRGRGFWALYRGVSAHIQLSYREHSYSVAGEVCWIRSFT